MSYRTDILGDGRTNGQTDRRTDGRIQATTIPGCQYWPQVEKLWFCRQQETSWVYQNLHSIESPSMVDPQWNIWYWGSKWNLHTVCWDAVGCEWGTTSVYFGITYVCFILSRLPVFAVEPQYRQQDFYVKSIIWRTHTKSSKNFMLV